MGDTLSITIRFGTMSIPLNIPREQEYAYRQAEKLIKEKYGFYTSKYPGQSENIYLIMTMVDMMSTPGMMAMPISTPLFPPSKSALSVRMKVESAVSEADEVDCWLVCSSISTSRQAGSSR